MIVPAPRCPRDLFNLFLRYEKGSDLATFFKDVRFAGATPWDLHYAILGQFPSADRLMENTRQNPRNFAIDLLLGEEFQRGIIPLALHAFPEKRRLIFVHIPKSAGSNLTAKVGGRYPSLPHTLSDRAWTPPAALFTRLKSFVTDLHWSDTVYAHGHNTLQWFIAHRLIRSKDHVFTVLRDPQGLVISQINFVLTRMMEDQEDAQPDVRHWRRVFGVTLLDPNTPQQELLLLAKRILHEAPRGWVNRICRFLGKGDLHSALRNIVSYNVEMTTLKRYDEWLTATWGVNPELRRVGESRKYLTMDMLDERDLTRVRELASDDQTLYDMVAAKVEAASAPSITGSALISTLKKMSNPPEPRVTVSANTAPETVADMDGTI